MYSVSRSYDNQPVYDDLFSGSYDQCVLFIRRQPRAKGAWAYDIVSPQGRLMSYVL